MRRTIAKLQEALVLSPNPKLAQHTKYLVRILECGLVSTLLAFGFRLVLPCVILASLLTLPALGFGQWLNHCLFPVTLGLLGIWLIGGLALYALLPVVLIWMLKLYPETPAQKEADRLFGVVFIALVGGLFLRIWAEEDASVNATLLSLAGMAFVLAGVCSGWAVARTHAANREDPNWNRRSRSDRLLHSFVQYFAGVFGVLASAFLLYMSGEF
ncbi:MAG: hypothetical protein M5U26_25875 [Planctomycetota bacterium]|nr:hypothetical protein [Planctomycetota bacterium]